jgi:hypothetical protein
MDKAVPQVILVLARATGARCCLSDIQNLIICDNWKLYW